MSDRSTDRVDSVVSTLFAEISDATNWLAELQDQIAETEHKRQKLLVSAEQALLASTLQMRTKWRVKLGRLALEGRKLGRPAGRSQFAVIRFILDRGTGFVTSAEVREHLARERLHATPQAVSNVLKSLVRNDVVHKAGHGRFAINPGSDVLLFHRWADGYEAEKSR